MENESLAASLADPDLLLIDVRAPQAYAEGHIAAAVQLDYADLVTGSEPAPGSVPPIDKLAARMANAGLSADRHVVAYDDTGGTAAARLIWILHLLGHTRTSWLNGGIAAWQRAGLPLSQQAPVPQTAGFAAQPDHSVVANKDYILARLSASDFSLLDARTPEEYQGTQIRAKRGGHIPGAVNLNWLDTVDHGHQRRLLPADTLQAMLTERDLTPDKEIVVYCQTHHRSSHAYVMLKTLGYPRVRGYPGSWSEWGNAADTPIEH